MSFINDEVFDQGLDYAIANIDNLHICNADPVGNYTNATSTYNLGNKDGVTMSATLAGDTDGRKITMTAITDGDVTNTDTATHWALVDVPNTQVIASGALSASQAVTNLNTFTLDAIDITIRDAS